MTFLGKAGLALGLLALGACSNPDRFSSGPSDGFGPGGPGLGDGAVTSGPLDPSSAAYFSQSVGDRVLFSVDQSTLGSEGRTVLQGQANWLNANPEYSAVIEGHADEQGTREYNLALGARRAASARDFLVSQGVAATRLRTLTYGKERPIEICSTEECYSKNRRAVTVVAGGAGLS